MADDVTIDNGDGTDFDAATDEAGGKHIQLFKQAYSADGSRVHGQVDADGWLVNLGANNDITGTVTLGAGTAEVGKLAAGTAAIGKLAANSGVDIGDVDVLSVAAVTPGTAAGNLGKAEDAVHTSGDTGVMSLAVRTDTEAVSSGTTGDYEPLHTDELGALRTSAAIVATDGTRLGLAPPIVVEATPSIDASLYAAGDNLDGTIITLADAVATSGGISHIIGVSILDKGDSGPNLSIFYLSASITPEAQNAAFTMTDADAAEIVAVVHTADGVWEDYVAGQKCFITPAPPQPIHCDATSLFAVVRVNGSYTPVSTSDLVIATTFLR